MRHKVTPTSEGLRTVLVLSFVLLWLLPGHHYGANGVKPFASTQRACNDKSCEGSSCGFGQICHKISHPQGDCYECKNCENARKYSEQVKPDGVFELEEKCLRIRIECAACPECVSQQLNMALASNSSREQSTESGKSFMDDPVAFTFFSAFLLSAMVNLFLLSIIIMTCKSSKKSITRDEDEGYETMMLRVRDGTVQK